MSSTAKSVKVAIEPLKDLIVKYDSVKSIKTIYKKCTPSCESILVTLQSTFTVSFLCVACFCLTITQYDQAIECLHAKSDIPPALIQHYCWIEGIFTTHTYGQKSLSDAALTPDRTMIRHKYYMWVYYVILLKTILFYSPRFLWRFGERCRLRDLAINEQVDDAIIIDTMKEGKLLFVYWVICDIYCLINLSLNVWLTNIFLSGQFLSLGSSWYKYSTFETEVDPLHKVFPRLAKCTIDYFGFSGSPESRDFLCYLPLNVVNEKIFLFLWFWYWLLFLFILVILVLRALVIFPFFRKTFLPPISEKSVAERVRRNIGYWFIIYMLASYHRASRVDKIAQAGLCPIASRKRCKRATA